MSNRDELIKWDKDHLLHTFRPTSAGPIVIFKEVKKDSHVVLLDLEGKEYIDLGAQVVDVNLGHGQKRIVDAVAKQMSAFQHIVTVMGYSNPTTIDCAHRLAGIVPEGLGHFLFTSGGSESVETAIRIARHYWEIKGKQKRVIISLLNGYHGMTLGSGSATGISRMWAGGLPAPDFVHVPGYYCYRCYLGEQYPSCNIRCAQFIEKTILALGQDRVAALIAEPVQGVGGSIDPPAEWWPMVRDICNKHEVLLIADEVMCGFGRTGKMFAVENWDISPDIMTMAKGINSGYVPFAAVAINDEIFNFFQDKPIMVGGFTYSGHPVGAAAAIAAMDLYKSENVIDNVNTVGKHARERLESEFLPLPNVGCIHGLGLMLSVELVTDKKTKSVPPINATQELTRRGRENGLLFRCAMFDKIQVAPPLIISLEEMDKGLDILLDLVRDFGSCLAGS
ncbi:MAG: aminotransferase class III-fold pyridoxal phosphate-dependent enzyme [Pseudomonadota bacterium]